MRETFFSLTNCWQKSRLACCGLVWTGSVWLADWFIVHQIDGRHDTRKGGEHGVAEASWFCKGMRKEIAIFCIWGWQPYRESICSCQLITTTLFPPSRNTLPSILLSLLLRILIKWPLIWSVAQWTSCSISDYLPVWITSCNPVFFSPPPIHPFTLYIFHLYHTAISDNGHQICAPLYAIVEDKSVNFHNLMSQNCLKFPLVMKTLLACGPAFAHEMAIVFNMDALHQVMDAGTIPTPLLLQHFVNHDALIHKIYVLGDSVFAQIRPSIRNFTANGTVPKRRQNLSANNVPFCKIAQKLMLSSSTARHYSQNS